MNNKLQKAFKLNKTVTIALILSMVAMWSTVVKADYKSEIIESCQDYQLGKNTDHVNACKLYIDGFIDAAIYTESAAIVEDSQSQIKKAQQSDFLERALQHRVSRLITSEAEFFNAQFCIYREDDRKVIASKIAKAINISALETKPLKQVLFETLMEVYPCEK